MNIITVEKEDDTSSPAAHLQIASSPRFVLPPEIGSIEDDDPFWTIVDSAYPMMSIAYAQAIEALFNVIEPAYERVGFTLTSAEGVDISPQLFVSDLLHESRFESISSFWESSVQNLTAISKVGKDYVISIVISNPGTDVIDFFQRVTQVRIQNDNIPKHALWESKRFHMASLLAELAGKDAMSDVTKPLTIVLPNATRISQEVRTALIDGEFVENEDIFEAFPKFVKKIGRAHV